MSILLEVLKQYVETIKTGETVSPTGLAGKSESFRDVIAIKDT